MKILFTLFTLSILFSMTGFSQDDVFLKMELPTDESGIITFTDVVQIPNNSKNELYSKAREWFVSSYNSADEVLQMEDKDSGKLIGKAYKEILIGDAPVAAPVKMYYTIKLYFKDGRYKYIITDIKYQGYASQYNVSPPMIFSEQIVIEKLHKKNGKVRDMNGNYKVQTIKAIRNLIENIRLTLAKQSKESNDDW